MPAAKMKETRHTCGTTLYSYIFFECNTSNNDAKLEKHNVFIEFLFFTSLNMLTLRFQIIGGILIKGGSGR